MQAAERQARLERAKATGRVAYRYGRTTKIFGNLAVDGEEKQLRELSTQGIAIELYYPWRPTARSDELSMLRIRGYGENIFELRWARPTRSRSSTMNRAIGSGRCALGPRLYRLKRRST